MRKSIREDQERSIEGAAQEGEGAATKGNKKQFYDTSKNAHWKVPTIISSNQEQAGYVTYKLG